jgi:phosphinothricin acetyltransferase
VHAADTLEVRPAETGDLAALVAIYNHYVTTTHFTFDTEPYSIATRRAWFDQFDGVRHRCMVLQRDGLVLGYANSAALKPKAAYATSVEVSIYLAQGATGKGLGAALYGALFKALAGQDVHRAYALIALPNAPSIAFHQRFGFGAVAHLHEVGRKFGRYWDVAWYEKRLG